MQSDNCMSEKWKRCICINILFSEKMIIKNEMQNGNVVGMEQKFRLDEGLPCIYPFPFARVCWPR